jgi:hypothetical protein
VDATNLPPGAAPGGLLARFFEHTEAAHLLFVQLTNSDKWRAMTPEEKEAILIQKDVFGLSWQVQQQVWDLLNLRDAARLAERCGFVPKKEAKKHGA